MNKRFHLYSLRYRMIFALIISLAIGGAVFILLTTLADYLIIEHYLNPTAYDQRAKSYADQLQSYVTEKNVSTTDSAALQEWVRQNPYAYMSLYSQNGVIWESGWWDDKTASAQEIYTAAVQEGEAAILGEETALHAKIQSAPAITQLSYDWMYPTTFADGSFWVSVTDFSDEPLYDITHKAIIAFSVFLVFPLVLLYAGRISKRVIRLTKEVETIRAGHLESPITGGGKDEIAFLAQGVDTMRRAVIEQLEKEQIAWRANSELITSMSHDIRTPLTVLLGYTGLIKNKQYANPEELSTYIDVIDKKAIQLKELSDKLFRYFLVFGDTEPPQLEAAWAKDLLAQAMGEHVALLADSGFTFIEKSIDTDCQIQVDLTFFKRLFDNVFSNIEKYGDPQIPCTITVQQGEKALSLRMTNEVSTNIAPVESTKIGLRTCARTMEQMGGNFQTETDGKTFTVTLHFLKAT